MPSAVRTEHCSSAEEFLDCLRRSNDRWWKTDDTCPWVFRGTGDADAWKLHPSAWRPGGGALEPMLSRLRSLRLDIGVDEDSAGVHRTYREWHAAEQQALFEFASLANEVGFSVAPESYAPESSPVAQGRITLVRGESVWPNIDHMALAQHHGIPTRLLDWTLNPYVAAFFAASPLVRSGSATRLCVWALDTSSLEANCGRHFYDGFRVWVHRPARGNNQFLHSQGGVFTEMLEVERYFLENQAWPALEDMMKVVEAPAPILIGHTLNCTEAPRLLTLLDRDSINTAALMPTLDNVAKTVIERWHR